MINITKTQPGPPCLEDEKAKNSGDYKCGNVLELTKNDFLNKCYLCEWKRPHTINVEHFISHQGDVNLKFDWNNLFWSCTHCNNTKLAGYDNILNCTDPNDKVEVWIKYEMDPFPLEDVYLTAMHNDIRVNNTIELLEKIYNGSTTLKKLESSNLRQSLLEEIIKLQKYLLIFYKDESTPDEITDAKNEIIRNIRRKSNFTSFKRWIIRRNKQFSADFLPFFD